MEVKLLQEHGYREVAIGFSLSYNTSIARAIEILPRYAFKNNGENKFLRGMFTWWDIRAPRFWLTELDTYKISTVRLSESTMHTLTKRPISNADFEYPIDRNTLQELNDGIMWYKNPPHGEQDIYSGGEGLAILKNALPEGYLQRIIYVCNYATLQIMYEQRKNHRLPQWKTFLNSVLESVEHPEFIRP